MSTCANEVKECSICFDEIQNTNNCTTPCGHKFCFECLIKAFQTNPTCPLCRSELTTSTNEDEVDEDDSEGDYEDDDEEDSDDEEDDSDDEGEGEGESRRIDVESILSRFEKKGYTIKDAMMLLLRNSFFLSRRVLYNREYMRKLENDFEELYVDIINEQQENTEMGAEDVRA